MDAVPLDDLDRKILEYYPEYSIPKSLVRKLKIGYNIPVYVLEHLLCNYADLTDPEEVKGLDNVENILQSHFLRPDMAEYVKSLIRERGSYRIIDRISAQLDVNENAYHAELQNLSIRDGILEDHFVKNNSKMLLGGMWAIIDLMYDHDTYPGRPFVVKDIHPIQLSHFLPDDFISKRQHFTIDEWIDLLIRSIGLEPSHMDRRQKLLQLLRLVPLAEINYNLAELGPRATGKSFVFREISPYSILLSGGNTTVAQLFYNLSLRRVGLVGEWDVVAFDEVAGIQFKDTVALQMLKDYMEAGSFARRVEVVAEASIVFNGNINEDIQTLMKLSHLFEPFPEAMQDTALIDRIHAYLPGWEVAKLMPNSFTAHYGFAIDYFSEIIRSLRNYSAVNAIDPYFHLGSQLNRRDEKAVRKTASGLLKLLFPDGSYTKEGIEEILRFSVEMRRRVKEQLKKLGGLEFWETNFSYIDHNEKREEYVAVQEGGTTALISQDPLPPGVVYAVSVFNGKNHLVKIEAIVSPGNGKLTTSGGSSAFRETVKTVYAYLNSNERHFMPSGSHLNNYNMTVQATPLLGNDVGGDVGISVFVSILSAIHRTTMKKGYGVIGDMSISGSLKTTLSFIDRVTILSENGARSITVPIDQIGNLAQISPSIFSKIIPIPITTPEDAFMRGRFEE
jgi:ATP-dependent Lon protease